MAARLYEYEENAVIMHEGIMDPRMFIVTSGKVVLYTGYGTSEERVLCVLGENKLFGELGLFLEIGSPYTVVAFSDVKLASFTKNMLQSFIKGYPEHAIKVMYNVAKMNQMLGENLKMLYLENADLRDRLEMDTMDGRDKEEKEKELQKTLRYNIAKYSVRGVERDMDLYNILERKKC